MLKALYLEATLTFLRFAAHSCNDKKCTPVDVQMSGGGGQCEEQQT